MTDRHTPTDTPAPPVSDTGGAGASLCRDAALWSETLQRIANFVAHDLRNTLNAVAVNLEVVRGRSARGAEAAAIAPFAGTAAGHFELAAAATEALLGFARPEPGRVDVAAVMARLERLLAVSGRETPRVIDRSEGRATTNAPADIVRAVVARSVLGALRTGEGVACEISADDGIFLRVIGATHAPPQPESDVVTAAAASGIQVVSHERSLELRFP